MTVGKSANGNYAVALVDNLVHGVWDATEVTGELYRIIDEDAVPECDWERIDDLSAEAKS